jgi:energy-coupling factor transporter ATP-binding protein EcfA2
VADTVFEEVALGISHLGVARTEIIERTYEALDELGITELAGRDPEQLSTGQQQLVVIAGLVAMKPSFLVLDEPLAHLDARSSQRVLATLDAAAASGAGILVAEQRTSELLHACSELIVLDGGKVERQGLPHTLLADPAVIALGIDEPAELRLLRLARESGLTLPESLIADR